MADVFAVRDEHRAQNWAMVIQECINKRAAQSGVLQTAWDFGEDILLLASETPRPDGRTATLQMVQLEPISIQDDILQIQYRGTELKRPSGVDMDTVSALLRSLQPL